MKPHNLVKNLGVFLGGCLVALAVLEVLLRVYNPLEIRFRPDRIVLPVHKRYVFDNTEKFPTKLAKTTIHTKNSLGFRGEEPPPDFRDYLTIITIGGSTTECFYLSDGRTWPDLLGQKLSREFQPGVGQQRRPGWRHHLPAPHPDGGLCRYLAAQGGVVPDRHQ